jgi:hypothetical protein
MAKRNADDNIMMRPLPSTRVPWLVIFVLIACIVLVYLGFLRPKDKLLGPPVPDPEYLQYVQPKKPPVQITPTPVPLIPPNTAQGTQQ